MRVIKLESLKDTDLCAFGAAYGTPSVTDERIGSGEEILHAIGAVNKIMGITDFQGFVADEIGGGSGRVTFSSSARFDHPVIDCDLMGRAYPSLEHGTTQVYGHSVLPCVTADCKGNISVVLVSYSTFHQALVLVLRVSIPSNGLPRVLKNREYSPKYLHRAGKCYGNRKAATHW